MRISRVAGVSLAAIAVGSSAAVVHAEPAPRGGLVDEVLIEEAENVQEAREEAAAADFDAVAEELDPAYAARIERIEARIANLQAQKAAIFQLPHLLRTTRYRVNRRHKHLRIIQCHKRIQLMRRRENMRLEIRAAREQRSDAQYAGDEQELARAEALIAKRRAALHDVEQLYAQRIQEIHVQISEIHR